VHVNKQLNKIIAKAQISTPSAVSSQLCDCQRHWTDLKFGHDS